jgi:putative copper resistance protein D
MPALLLVIARGFHFASGMILVGMVAFRWLVLLPAFARAPDETWQIFEPLFRRFQVLYRGAAAILVVSGFAIFWAVAAGMSGASLTESLTTDTFGTVFLQTQFGTVCQWRLGFLAVFIVMLGKLFRDQWLTRGRASLLELGMGLVVTALVLSISWTGHAAASGGPTFPWRVSADVIHLLAASIWPAGLLPFALFLSYARRIEDPACLSPALEVTRRFSALSFATVGVLIASGAGNACLIVGSIQGMIFTDYGRLLDFKLGVFLVILGIAGWNRYHLLPLLFSRARGTGRSTSAVWIRLRTFVSCELGLAVLIILVVAVLGTTPSPR